MSNSRRGIDMIYSNHFMGGNRVVDFLDGSAKKVGLMRNVIGPITKLLGIKAPRVEKLVQQGYGKKRKGAGRPRKPGRPKKK